MKNCLCSFLSRLALPGLISLLITAGTLSADSNSHWNHFSALSRVRTNIAGAFGYLHRLTDVQHDAEIREEAPSP